MRSIFLSASVPIAGRGDYYNTTNPFLIQSAVKELVVAVIRHHKIVWGGHPSITPMIWSICEDLDVDYSKNVVLYQSRHFEDVFPEENERFENVIFTDDVSGNRDVSLLLMRKEMLSRNDLDAAVFIGGMEGVEDEYNLFREYHPNAKVLPVGAPGGAARKLAVTHGLCDETEIHNIDFVRLFHTHLSFLTAEHAPTNGNRMKP